MSAANKGYDFLQRAICCLEAEFEQPTPATVIALVVLWHCLAELGKTTASWIYNDLGLHVDPKRLVARGMMTEEVAEARSRAFWTLYVEDNLDLVVQGGPSKGMISLAEIITRIIGLQSTLKTVNGPPFTGLLKETSQQLYEWPQYLPEESRLSSTNPGQADPPQVIIMHTTYNTCVILLYRPLLQRHRLGPTEIQICIDAALSTVTLAKAYDLTYSMAKTPVHMSQNLYAAGSVLDIVLAQHEDHAEDMRWRAKRALKDVAELLEKMSASWACAGQALSALSQLERDREKAGTPTEAVGTASHNIGEWPGVMFNGVK
ncbi:hypothetical protein EHS25_005180 [Saitozyma podzolica]|uniref:Transcription factor domain-containing protein n=1 Tax=Saitozyma podzolica TaxID=1890683 RepID=A0A427XYH7_9TREE|nr:hypothetical protein EHS25_005180 [Saitozyma podzolica]